MFASSVLHGEGELRLQMALELSSSYPLNFPFGGVSKHGFTPVAVEGIKLLETQ